MARNSRLNTITWYLLRVARVLCFFRLHVLPSAMHQCVVNFWLAAGRTKGRNITTKKVCLPTTYYSC